MKEINLWNDCTCPGSSKQFLSLFSIHTCLVHAGPGTLQLITAYVSKAINKIFFLKVELHNNSLYGDPCSASCVIILMFFTFTYCTDLLTVFFLRSHKYLHDSASQKPRVRDGTGSLATHHGTLSFFSR